MSLQAVGIVAAWENVTPQQIAVGFHLANCHNAETGKCCPSIAYLASKVGLTERSVQRILQQLNAMHKIGIIHNFDEDGRQRASTYRIENLTQASTGGEPNDTPEGETHDTPEGDTSVLQKQEEETGRKKHKRIRASVSLPDDIDPSLWEEWMDLRKRKKAVNTERAMNSLLSRLEDCKSAGIAKNRAITIAIEESWKSIRPDWLEKDIGKNKASITSEFNRRAI